ncbi:MAG: DUF3025 domain-containing protein [Myxococcales bacterium]
MALSHARGFSRQVFLESPWYAWLEPMLSRVTQGEEFPAPEVWTQLHAELAPRAGVPALTFASAPAKKPRRRTRTSPVVLGELYEGRIVERGQVPTRLDDWHDFFNALAFLAFPAAKWALHARQYRLLQARIAPHARRLPGARTREQDALSLLDEGGILVALPSAHAAALPDDPEAFERALAPWFEARVARAVPFGHALFEHLVLGRDDMLGTLVVVPVTCETDCRSELRTVLDRALAELLCDPTLFQEPSRARGLPLARLTP